MTPTKAQRWKARVVVASWSAMLWLSRPDWLNRMPDERDTKTLIEAVANMLAQQKDKPSTEFPKLRSAGLRGTKVEARRALKEKP
jgi:hypothetical protein